MQMQQIMGSIDQIVRLLCAIGFSGPDCRSNYIWLRRLELSAALDLGQAAEEGDVRAGHGACRVKYSDNHGKDNPHQDTVRDFSSRTAPRPDTQLQLTTDQIC